MAKALGIVDRDANGMETRNGDDDVKLRSREEVGGRVMNAFKGGARFGVSDYARYQGSTSASKNTPFW